MTIAFHLATTLLILFALLGLYDGFYLHIFKYQLHNHSESRNEHITHTIRALLCPAILYFLYLQQNSPVCFYIGISLVILDIIVLGCDAYLEGDSRSWMGGLPRWEYILHLFVNGFHFAGVAVFLALKLQVVDAGISIQQNLSNYPGYHIFELVVKNILPGAVLIALLHILVIVPKSASVWNGWRSRITCC